MENPIVLDFKLVVLCSEHTIWNASIFYYSFRSMLFSITVKKCTKYTILCKYTRLESNTIGFPRHLNLVTTIANAR
jgi:hypothetical protein